MNSLPTSEDHCYVGIGIYLLIFKMVLSRKCCLSCACIWLWCCVDVGWTKPLMLHDKFYHTVEMQHTFTQFWVLCQLFLELKIIGSTYELNDSVYFACRSIMASFIMYVTCSFLWLYLICFIYDMLHVFRFWTVRCTIWTCSGYWTSCAKPVIPQDWALLYQYERSMLLEDIFCASTFETQQARCRNSFNTTSILPFLYPHPLFMGFLYFNWVIIMFMYCAQQTTTILKKHMLIDLIAGNLHRSWLKSNYLLTDSELKSSNGFLKFEIIYLKTIFYTLLVTF